MENVNQGNNTQAKQIWGNGEEPLIHYYSILQSFQTSVFINTD